jgi:hypothetical protein
MPESANRRYALLLGHPGHELRVLGWATRQRPLTAVLTDGSGADGVSRMPMTLAILDAIGCPSLAMHDGLTDAGIYAAILDGRTSQFLDIAERFAERLQAFEISHVVSDGVEGYNPTHDLCAALAARATRLCAARTGRPVAHYTFPLVGPAVPEAIPAEAELVELDDAEVSAKLQLSRQYAARAGGVLVAEVEEMIERLGVAGFAREMLAPAELDRDFSPFQHTPPFYESYGQQRVAAGHYKQAIRYREHMLPILETLLA